MTECQKALLHNFDGDVVDAANFKKRRRKKEILIN
jgi:hypothetical protein